MFAKWVWLGLNIISKRHNCFFITLCPGSGFWVSISTVRSERAAVDIAAPGGGLCAARQLLSAKIESLSRSLRYQLFRRSRRQPPGRSVGWIKQLSGFILQYKCSGIFLFYLAASKQFRFSIEFEAKEIVSACQHLYCTMSYMIIADVTEFMSWRLCRLLPIIVSCWRFMFIFPLPDNLQHYPPPWEKSCTCRLASAATRSEPSSGRSSGKWNDN